MDKKLFEKLTLLIRAGGKVLGIAEERVQIQPETISFQDSGITLWWMRDSLGKNRNGWQLRESYHSFDMVSGENRLVSKTLANFGEEDIFGAAKATLAIVVDRTLDIVLSELVDGNFER